MKTSTINATGIFDSLSSETITLSAYKFNPITHQNNRLVTWNEEKTELFFRPLEVSGERISIHEFPEAVVIHTNKEPELIIDDSNWNKTVVNGGTEHYTFTINESELTTSANLLTKINPGTNLGQIFIEIIKPFVNKDSIYSLGISGNTLNEWDTTYLLQEFRFDTENTGLFEKFEYGEKYIRNERIYNLSGEIPIYLYCLSGLSSNIENSKNLSGEARIHIFYDYINQSTYNKIYVLSNPTQVLNLNTTLNLIKTNSSNNTRTKFDSSIDISKNKIYINNTINDTYFLSYLPNIDLFETSNLKLNYGSNYPTSEQTENEMYFIAGQTHTSQDIYSNNIEKSSFSELTFSILTTLDYGYRSLGSSIVNEEKIYLFGGYKSNYIQGQSIPDPIEESYVNTILEFNINTNTVEELETTLIKNRENIKTIKSQDEKNIYLLGGNDASSFYNIIEKFEVETNTISNLNEYTLFNISYGSSVEIENNKGLYIGGYYYSTEASRNIIPKFIQEFDCNTSTMSLYKIKLEQDSYNNSSNRI